MKKLISLLLAAGMVASLAACGSTASTSESASTADSTSEAASTAEAETTGESDLQYIKDKGKMTIGYTVYAPMNYTDENGEFVGFDT